MELKEIRTFRNGLENWDYDTIESILNENAEMNAAWCDCCGITNDDERRIYGWPKHFEKFYAGYIAAINQNKEVVASTIIIAEMFCKNCKDDKTLFCMDLCENKKIIEKARSRFI